MSTDVRTATATIPLGSIEPSKTNPRKTHDKAQLEELADSIRKVGVLQPVLVRPHGNGSGKPYELVAGERRWRAAKVAGLAEIPALVRELGDGEVLEIQVIENLQRTDLHPLEEAEGYEQLMKLQDYSVEDLAAKVGKSKAYVYARLKLVALVPEARKAFREAKLNPSTALLVARIPVPELQKKAIAEITGDRFGEPMSVREAAEFIQEEFMLRLADAPWPAADAQLVAAAGPCTTCPKRTGNQRELFDDVKSADVCTDPTCFAKKRAAWQAHLRAEAEATGRQVIAGKEAKAVKPNEYSDTLKGYVALSQACYEDPQQRTYQALLGKATEGAALLEDPKTKQLVSVMRTTEVAKALKAKGYSWAEQRRTVATNSASAAARQREARAELERTVRRRVFEAVREKVKTLAVEDLRLVAASFFDRLWDENRKQVVALWKPTAKKGMGAARREGEALIRALKPGEIPRFLIDLALIADTNVSSYGSSSPQQLLAAAKRHGVAAGKIRAAVAAEARAAAKAKATKAKAPKTRPAGKKAA